MLRAQRACIDQHIEERLEQQRLEAMSSYVFEQIEIASYTTLRAAAEHCGDTERGRVAAPFSHRSRSWRLGSPGICPRSR